MIRKEINVSEHNEQEVVKKMISRRGFLKAGGAAMGTVVLGGVVAGCGDNVTRVMSGNGSDTPVTPTTVMTLEKANEIRKEMLAKKGPYTRTDTGEVIPVEYVRLRALTNSIGLGLGSEVTDSCFEEFQIMFTKEEAQQVIEMPVGVYFTATDYALVSGRDEASCVKICEDLANKGRIFRERRSGVPYYHLMAMLHGLWEANMNNYTLEYCKAHANEGGKDIGDSFFNSETPFYYTVPVNKQVTSTGKVLPYDDYETVIKRNTLLAVTHCQCHLHRKVMGQPGIEDLPYVVDRCIATGDEAAFYLEMGIGRQITQDEALEIMKRDIDLGMVVQHAHSKKTEVICRCHPDVCNILGGYMQAFAMVNGDMSVFNSMPNVSHHTLKVDKSICIKCGACEKRCPMKSAKLDATVNNGYPTVDGKCVRCGQCGITCPREARKLVLKDKYPELPQEMLDDYNLKAHYRMSKNKVY